MSETRDPEQEPAPPGEMPEEFRLFREAIHTNPDSLASDSPLDTHIATWEHILSVWDRYLCDSPYRPQALQIRLPALLNGARLYLLRFKETQRVEDLERALQLCQEAYQQLPQDAPELPAIENNLLYMLNTLIELQGWRYQQLHDIQDLQRSNQLCEQALSLAARNPDQRPRYLYYLSQGNKELYRLSGERDLLEQALVHLSEAAEICLPDSPYLFPSLELLGYVLRERFTYTDDLADLRGAGESWRRAVQTTGLATPEILILLNNIGDIMVVYYKRTQDLADIDRALAIYEAAIALPLADPAAKIPAYFNLATTLVDRYERAKEPLYLTRAIDACQEALGLNPPDPQSASRCAKLLSGLLRERYTYTQDENDLKRALVFEREWSL